MIIGNHEFDTKNHTYCMGILNVTPDSFSDGGHFNNMDNALKHVEQMISEGAHIIDIGGESTRPGYTLISDEEEIDRTAPIIETVKKEFDIPVSLDTYKSKVALAGISAGADLINDVWGLKYDSDMTRVISDKKVACCLMHNKKVDSYVNLLDDVTKEIEESVHIALESGISPDNIILDPGVGFAKDRVENLSVIANIKKFDELGYPLLLGCSRKSVIGLTLDLPVDQRLEGTLVTTVYAVMNNVAFVRVHDVLSNVRAIKMAEAIRMENVYGSN